MRKDSPLGPEEIERAPAFLASPMVAGAEARSERSHDDVATAAPEIVASRLRSLADALERGSSQGGQAAGGPKGTGRLPEVPISRSDAAVIPAEVRAWARANGHEVSASGRLPSGLVSEYKASLTRP
jgi:hypothetical protein